MYQAVRKNFEEKISYIARTVPGMTVTDQSSFLSVDCGLPSDTFNVLVSRMYPHQHRCWRALTILPPKDFLWLCGSGRATLIKLASQHSSSMA